MVPCTHPPLIFTGGSKSAKCADEDWRGVGRPQVAMHLQLQRFLVIYVLFMYRMGDHAVLCCRCTYEVVRSRM